MGLVSSRLSLTHRATIQRDSSIGTADTWGTPSAPSFQDHLTDLPCRVQTTAGREAVDASTLVVVEDMRLLVTVDTDVTEQDRVSVVTYRGDAIVAGPVSIRAVLRHQDHLELVLVRLA